MSEWRKFRVGDIADVFDGPHATPKKVVHGPWFLSISSLKRGRLALSESAHVTEEDFTKWTRRVTPEPGDVLFSYETRLGEAALMPPGIRACLGRRMGLLRPNREFVDPQFLLLSYLSPKFQQTIKSRTIPGATVDRISLTDLPSWPIALPSISTQRAIAATLGALDDKIATNEKLSNTIDHLIQSLFKQATADTGTTEFPLLEALEITFGAPFASKEFNSVEIGRPLIRIRDLKTFKPQVWTTQKHEKEKVVKPGDTIAGMDAEFRPTFWIGVESLLNQRVMHVTSKVGGGSSFCREALRQPLAEVEGYKTGTTVAHLNKSDLNGLTVKVPGPQALKAFENSTSALHSRMIRNATESRTLSELRDTLLPQLMSGKLRVKDAEKIVEDNV